MSKRPKNRGGYLGGGTVFKPGSGWFGYEDDLDSQWSPIDAAFEKEEADAEKVRIDRLLVGDAQLDLHPIANKAMSLREKSIRRKTAESKRKSSEVPSRT